MVRAKNENNFLAYTNMGGKHCWYYRGVVTDSSTALRCIFKMSPISPFELGLNGILCLVVSF